MTIVEYDVRFSKLSCYAPWLVDNEERRTSRFVCGLANYLFSVVVPQRYTQYADAVDCAIMMKEKENKARAKRARKRGPRPKESEPSSSVAS